MKILGTGLTGLVGSRIVQVLGNDHEFSNLSLSEGVDIRDARQVYEKVAGSDAAIVLHLAAKTDVDACENDKDDSQILGLKGFESIDSFDTSKINWANWRRSDSAYAVNVLGTHNIAASCHQTQKKLIYISTDFVFDGTLQSPYHEDDHTQPISFYGLTKRIGEIVVQQHLPDALIVRIAYPYGGHHESKKDFVQRISDRLKNGETVQSPTDNTMTPTHIDDIAVALQVLAGKDASGIFHVVGSRSMSSYDASLAIAKAFDYDKSLITKTTHKAFFKGRARRPQHLLLSNANAKLQGIIMKGFEEGLKVLGTR